MLRLGLITALTIAILSPAQQESRSDAGARRFVSLEGRFSISLPDRFQKLTKLNIPVPSGNAYGNLYEWKTKEGTFGAGYADTFQPLKDPEAVKQFFDGVTERFRKLAEANNGTVAVIKTITLDNHPGIEQRAEIFKASFIQRTYLVSRRIYETLVVVTNSQRDESTAVRVLDSFKLLSDPEITEEALKAGPGPLPQTPRAPRAGSDAGDEGLRGPVKSVRTEIQYLSETPVTTGGMRTSLTTYNEKGDKLRTESYDFKNNLYLITVYGYLDGNRVSASKYIQREYGPPVGSGGGGPRPSNRKMDTRYQQRFEFRYDEKNRLTEKTDFLSNGDMLHRYVYKYEGNQKQELLYLEDGSPAARHLYILDDKGNAIERTDFEPDGSVRSKISYTYEFDSNGNWTKRTSSWNVVSDRLRQLDPPSVHLRTITYY
ncbi:MAG TPA: hypothetical protein VFP64_20935 [Pyrinomonadaceae bacterium]|nr:hypothetical protein [Pyrinomonadaceae bacterium]